MYHKQGTQIAQEQYKQRYIHFTLSSKLGGQVGLVSWLRITLSGTVPKSGLFYFLLSSSKLKTK
jgi:hypothetical protein